MSRNLTFVVLILLAGLSFTGCSAKTDPIAPPTSHPGESSSAEHRNSRIIWGIWDAHWSVDTNSIEMVPRRDSQVHFNTLAWLEQAPCSDCLKVTGIISNPDGSLSVDVEITHPFDNLKFTGFDVRGIAMFDPGYDFPEHSRNIPDRNLGNGELVNPDGYTFFYNGDTENSGYVKGRYAGPASPAATLNGYKRYFSYFPSNDRKAFLAGDTITRTFDIFLPSSPFVFGYAVDANWAVPTVDPPVDVETDFPPEANCPEPWNISVVHENEGALTDTGGTMSLLITVYDYDGLASFNDPVVECPELFDGTVEGVFSFDGGGYYQYTAEIENEKLAPEGDYKLLVSVQDVDAGSQPEWIDLTAYEVDPVHVSHYEGWAKRWGGPQPAYGWDIASDDDGNLYVAGSFSGDEFTLIDFDPGPDTAHITSNGKSDCFLSKFNPDGEWQWVKVWGSAENDRALCVDINAGLIVIGGYFEDTVDFDPSPFATEKISNGNKDGFITVYDLAGDFQWVETFGGGGDDETSGVAVDENGFCYTAGYFTGDVDFDPLPPDDMHSTGVWNPAAFVSRYSSTGSWYWTRSWGEGIGLYNCKALGCDVDANSNINVVGYYREEVDFDPGPDPQVKISNGEEDAFATGFDINGGHDGVLTWGGIYSDKANDIAILDYEIFITGGFRDEVDFDAIDGGDIHHANDDYDAFLVGYSNFTTYNGVATWGQNGSDIGNAVSVSENSIYVTGEFFYEVDFDPTPAGSWPRTSAGLADVFLAKYDSSFTFEWATSIGGFEMDRGFGVTSDAVDNACIAGAFQTTADFDPTDETFNMSAIGSYDVFIDRILSDGGW